MDAIRHVLDRISIGIQLIDIVICPGPVAHAFGFDRNPAFFRRFDIDVRIVEIAALSDCDFRSGSFS